MSGALALVSPLASLIFGKKPKAPAVIAPVQQRVNTAAADALQSRRGSGDNKRSGSGGAEASGGLKSKLGQ